MSEVNSKMKKDTFETLLVRVPVLFFSFLYSVFLVKMLGPEGNGLYSFLMSSLWLSILIFGLDAKKSVMYFIVREEFDTARVLGLSFTVFGLSSLLVASIVLSLYLAGSSITHFFIPEEYLNWFFVLFFIASFICQHFTEMFTNVILGSKEFRKFNIYLFSSSLLQVILYGSGFLLIHFLGMERNFIQLFSLVLGIQATLLLMVFIIYLKIIKIKVSFKTKSITRPFIRYSTMNYMDQIGHFLNKRMDVWFIEFYVGLKSLGVYTLSSQLTNFLLLFSTPVEEVLKPYLIGMERKEGNAVFVQYFRMTFYLILGLAMTVFIFSTLIISLFFGDEFMGAVSPLQILAFGVVFVYFKRMFINYNTAFNDLGINIWAQWLGVLATVILDLILIPKHGIVGAAWASLIAYSITSIILGIYFSIKQKIGPIDLLLLRKEDLIMIRDLLKSQVKRFS